MLRPLPRVPDLEPESVDSDSFGGLADVLEPDAFGEHDDATTAVSMRRLPTPSSGSGAPPPISIRAPVQDFAFADTIFATEEVEAPPSGPIFFTDATNA